MTLLLFAAGCGGGDEEGAGIPARQAEALITQLDQVEADVGEGKCGAATFKVGQLEEKVAALPRSVSQDVRDNLAKAITDLRALVQSDCSEEEPTDTTTEETTTESVPTVTETTEPTETTETQPTETTPPETTETLPPDTTPGNGGVGPPGQEEGD